MKGSDKTLMIYKLKILNRYLEKDKERLSKDIEYWKEEIGIFGKDKIIVSMTYGEVLKIINSQLEDTLKEIEENNKLIEVLYSETTKGGVI